jgi:NAD(P)-dependent dehydrogenase (short-subunit alcohol dehydrogenase family)
MLARNWKTGETAMKYALLTGATGGLGGLCARALAGTGRWTVFAAGTNPEALEEMKKLERIVPVEMDVTSPESVERARAAIASRVDRLDAVVHFAGLTAFTSMVEGDAVAVIERLLAVNVTGAARVNRAFFEMVEKAKGRIVHISSEVGWMTPQPFAGPYALSKRALEAYNDSLRRELMFLGVRVIKIQPGSFETRITRQVQEGFDRALAGTRFYRDVLTKMRPLMDMELKQKNDPGRLTGTVLHAMEARRPRLNYRVGTGKLLLLLELLPEAWVDALYRAILKFRRAA